MRYEFFLNLSKWNFFEREHGHVGTHLIRFFTGNINRLESKKKKFDYFLKN